MKTTSLPHDAEALSLRFAGRVAAGLSERAADMPHDLSERLRFAREKALAQARTARRTADGPVSVGGGAAAFGGGTAWWQRLAAVLPLIMLVAGLLLIQERVALEQVEAAAEIDAVLLADDLPPEAYSDPGFGEFLRAPPP